MELFRKSVQAFYLRKQSELLNLTETDHLEDFESIVEFLSILYSQIITKIKWDNDNKNSQPFAQKLQEVDAELDRQVQVISDQLDDKRTQLHHGLTPARIQQFHQFRADETLEGGRCGVCLDDIEVGRPMMQRSARVLCSVMVGLQTIIPVQTADTFLHESCSHKYVSNKIVN